MSNLGNAIRLLRTVNNLTQSELAELISVDNSYPWPLGRKTQALQTWDIRFTSAFDFSPKIRIISL